MTPEGKVKQWLKRRLQIDLPGVWLYMPPGGFFGRAGMMDLLGLYQGVSFGVEIKATADDEPTELQMKRLRDFGDANGIGCVMKGKDFDRLNLLTSIVKDRATKIAGVI